MCKSITYQRVRSKVDLWTWELNFRWSVDDLQRVAEAQRELTRWTNLLSQFPAVNIERSYEVLARGRKQIENSKLILGK